MVRITYPKYRYAYLISGRLIARLHAHWRVSIMSSRHYHYKNPRTSRDRHHGIGSSRQAAHHLSAALMVHNLPAHN